MTACPPTSAASTSFDLGPARALSCRECGHQIPLGRRVRLPECFGPLEVAYDFGGVTRESIEAGPKSIWRYRQLLPVPTTVAAAPRTPSPACTRLIKADRLGAALGIRNLWVKDDTGNPTHSFKDRVVAVALAAARELGFTRAGLPVHRQPGQRRRRRRRPRGLGLGGADPVVAGAGQDPHDRRVRRHPARRRRQLRRREPAGHRAGRRARGLGVRQRQRPPVLRRGLQDPRATRSPSSSAGGCPSRSWCRSPPARS